MSQKLPIATVAGIRVYVHWTFSLLVLWIIVSGVRAGSGALDIAWSLLFVLSMFTCVVLHELGHALAARRYGIKTRDITLLPIGGVASLESMPEKPSEELVVALAGPAVNFVIALLLLPVVSALPNPSQVEQLNTIHAGNFLLALLSVNLVLALFNLLPAFPMDGGRVLRALLAMRLPRAQATRVAALVGQLCAVGFVVLGFTSNPMLALVGIFIFVGAQSEASYTNTKSMLAGYTVRDVMLREFRTIEAGSTVGSAVQLLLDTQCRTFLVMEESTPVGILTREAIIRALSEGGDGALVRQVMDPELLALGPELPLDEAFQRMSQQRKELMPVMEGGQLVGALDHENVAEFVMILTAKAK